MPKRIAVIGGGPAGIEAARTAAQRGHTVDLYEKEDHLGGVLTMAGAPKFKQDIKKICRMDDSFYFRSREGFCSFEQ